jgi:hypothetical protein
MEAPDQQSLRPGLTAWQDLAGTLPGPMGGNQTCRFNELGIEGADRRAGYRKLQFTVRKL